VISNAGATARGISNGKPVSFKRNQKVYFDADYNLGMDDKAHKPSATFEYNVINNAATNKR
jgi:hypothetical protein